MSVKHLTSQDGHQHTPGYSGIHIKPQNKGKLHRRLGVPQGEKIPVSKIKAAENSSSPSLRSEAQFVDNARSWK